MEEEKVVPDKTGQNAPDKPKKKYNPPKEVGGRDGPDPVRYGDWENKGIASDF